MVSSSESNKRRTSLERLTADQSANAVAWMEFLHVRWMWMCTREPSGALLLVIEGWRLPSRSGTHAGRSLPDERQVSARSIGSVGGDNATLGLSGGLPRVCARARAGFMHDGFAQTRECGLKTVPNPD